MLDRFNHVKCLNPFDWPSTDNENLFFEKDSKIIFY